MSRILIEISTTHQILVVFDVAKVINFSANIYSHSVEMISAIITNWCATQFINNINIIELPADHKKSTSAKYPLNLSPEFGADLLNLPQKCKSVHQV